MMFAEMVKNINPKILTILGGPQATFMPKQALLEMPFIDLLCRGEGELVLPELCECVDARTQLRYVRGIVFKENGYVIENIPRISTKFLDEFESPFMNGVFNFKDHATACMLSSRGCSFTCRFCYTPNAFLQTVRLHSPQRVLSDMEVCIDNGISDFWFADPSFVFNKQWAMQILNRIIDKHWNPSIWIESHAALVDKELLTAMARAGVRKIAYGLETADKEVLKIINKDVDLDRLRKTVKTTQDLGIEVELMHIYGLPGQTYESARRTIEFIKGLDVKIRGNSIGQPLKLYFGTTFCDDPQKYGIYLRNRKRPLFLSPGTEFETKYMNKRIIKSMEKIYSAESYLDGLALSIKNRASNLRKTGDIIARANPFPISQNDIHGIFSKHKSKNLRINNVPAEIKMVGDDGPKKNTTSRLLYSLFRVSNTYMFLTMVNMPAEILDDIKACLERFKYNICELRIETDGEIDSEQVKSLMMLHRHFEKEAAYFQTFNRLKIIPLIRLRDFTNASRKNSLALWQYFKRFGLEGMFFFRESDCGDFRRIELALREAPLKNKKILIYSKIINSEMIKLALKHNNIVTFHDGINRCLRLSGESSVVLCCGAGKGQLFVYGDTVYPCYGGFLAGISMGCISEQSLEEILQNYHLSTSLEECRECGRRHFCRQCRFMPTVAREVFCKDTSQGRSYKA